MSSFPDADVFLTPSSNPDKRSQLIQAIAAQDALRGSVADAVIDTAIAALKDRLAALEAQEPGSQHRKLVSVLFMDIVGSTEIIRDLDPEDSAALMDGALQRLAPLVARHGGRVTRFMGDGFVALFGDPIARENDPEMAIRAGLAMLTEAESYANEVESGWGIEAFGIRVGINTGLVVIGGYAEAEDTLTGAPVNLAARLEAAAPSQGLLISHGTYQHVSRLFYTEPHAPVPAKGFREPVPVYLVRGARPRAFRMGRHGVEGIQTQMVGRAAEMGKLQDTLQSTIARKTPNFMTLVADAGLGKSRLLDEFERWLDDSEQNVSRLKGRARQEMQRVPYSLLRDIFAHHFEIQDDDPASEVWRKLGQGFGNIRGLHQDLPMKMQIIGHLLGYDFEDSAYVQVREDDPQQIRDRALKYLLEALRLCADHRPIVVFLEDLHWADESSLDIVARLGDHLHGCPIFILAAARPELFQKQPDWHGKAVHHARLDLAPLSERDCTQLVEDVLQKVDNLPSALRDLIVRNAEGNPFHAEELIKMLVEDGVLEKTEPQWRVHIDQLAGEKVPPTLTGVLQARLDGLPEDERTVLQQASIAGRVFWSDLVGRLHKDGQWADSTSIVGRLARLQEREMIFERDVSSFAGTEEYMFKHAVLREVAYESVLKRLRRVFHRQIARWLIDQCGDRQREFAGLIADHLQMAGDLDEAKAYLVMAAEQAAAGYANREAIAYYSRAIELAPAGDFESRFACHQAREKLLDLLGDRQAQSADLQEIKRLADRLDKPEWRAAGALRWSKFAEKTGDFRKALGEAEQALKYSELANLPSVTVAARNALAWALWKQGDIEKARRQAETGAALAKRIGDRTSEGKVRNTLGNLAWQAGDFETARLDYVEFLKIVRETKNRRGEAAALNNLGAIALTSEDYLVTRRYLEDCLQIMREIGDRQREGTILGNLGLVAATLGNFAEAQRYNEQSLRIARQVGDRQSEGFKLSHLGWLAAKRGDYHEAKTHLEASLKLAGESGATAMEAEARTALGHAELGLGNEAAAAEAYRAALALYLETAVGQRATEAIAGLARVNLVNANLAGAMEWVDQLLPHLDGAKGLEGVEEPRRIYHTCYQVLLTRRDERAEAVLGAAYHRLQRAAARLPDPGIQKIFLEAVPWRRAILADWQVSQTNG